MDLGEAVRVAGIGCRSGVGASEVIAAVRAASGGDAVDALATVPGKAGEAGVAEAAVQLGLPLIVGAAAPEDGRFLTVSAASLAAVGAPSASEAAALAAAGPGGRLLGPRLAVGRVTCAIAVSGESA